MAPMLRYAEWAIRQAHTWFAQQPSAWITSCRETGPLPGRDRHPGVLAAEPPLELQQIARVILVHPAIHYQ